jgi:hypothetical protein
MGNTFSVGPKTYGDPSFFINPPRRVTMDGGFQIINVSYGWSYTSSNTNVATILNGNYISIVGAGTTTINATGTEWFGDGNNQVHNIDTTLIVNKKNPTLSNFTIGTKNTGVTFTIPPPNSDSNGTFSYTVVFGDAVTISGTSATTTRADNVTIRAIQAESTNYGSGSIDTTFTVINNTPTLSNFTIGTKNTGATFTIPPPNSNSNGTFSYSVVSGNATISGTSATVTTIGNVTIRATQAASTNYGSGSIDTTFTVINTSSLTSTKSAAIVNKLIVNGSIGFDFFSTNNTDGSYVRSYSSSNSNVLSIPNSSIASGTIVGSGSVTITVNQTATSNFNSISVPNIITIVIIGNNSTYSSLDMTNVDLSGSNLSSTIFSNCNMTNANLFGTTVNSNTDLHNVTTLQSLRSGRINGVTALLPIGYNMI